MRVDEYRRYDGLGLAELVKLKMVSPKDLVEAAFKRIEEVNPALNAVVRTYQEQAYKEALALKLNGQPFAGVPILLKDISQRVLGQKITCGSILMKDYVSQGDSHFVQRLKQAGFIIIGHTNTPEYGLRNITENKLYGATRNPWNLEYSPGGSSGGSAASVASGIVPIAGASDGGGSIRIPASFTSLFGMKPTRGRTPVGPGSGRQWHGAAIDFCLTRSVRDSAQMFDVLSVFQPEAAFQAPVIENKMAELINQPETKKFKIAFTTKSPVGTKVDPEASEAVHKLVKLLEEQGHFIEEAELPVDGLRLIENYYLMNCGEMASDMLFIEEMTGKKASVAELDIVAWVLYQVGLNLSAVEFTRSLAEWDVAAAQMATFHQKYDLVITPATASSAPQVGELMQTQTEIEKLLEVNELSKKDQLQLVYDMFLPSLTYTPFTQLSNLTGQPAMSLPVHLTKGGLPLGVQVMAPKGREDWLYQLAIEVKKTDLWIDSKREMNYET
ncbi:MAG: amidase [Bacillales bacterium]|jgi:amidase|nr:amidase [Bacillales bacterium]